VASAEGASRVRGILNSLDAESPPPPLASLATSPRKRGEVTEHAAQVAAERNSG